MTKLKCVMAKNIIFRVTDKILEDVDGKVGEGYFHSRGDYLRDLIRKDNLR